LLRGVARALGDQAVDIRCGNFESAIAEAGRGDFVYCDPPYAPVSKTACFAHYTAGGFSVSDQARLLDALIAASHRGATIVLSNSAAPEMVRLYAKPEARRAGLHVERVPARRAISSKGHARGPVDELVVTNTPPRVRLRMAKASPPVSVRRRAS
jgi:site-specific DNA-adenine methylase